MSNRYVWNRYSLVTSQQSEEPPSVVEIIGDPGGSWKLLVKDSVTNTSFSGNSTTGVYRMRESQADNVYEMTSGDSQNIAAGMYFTVHNSAGNGFGMYLAKSGGASIRILWEYTAQLNNALSVYPVRSKGSFNATLSNSGASTYPPNDARPRIASICVIPALLRRCNHVE